MAIEDPVRAPELEEAARAYEDGRRGDIRAPLLRLQKATSLVMARHEAG